MYRYVTAIFLLSVVTFAAAAGLQLMQKNASDTDEVRTALKVPDLVDFGSVEQAVHHGEIAIANPGARAVTIERIETSCSCTTSKTAFPLVVEGEESVVIPFDLDLKGKVGFAEQTVVIVTDSDDDAPCVVRIRAMVDQGLIPVLDPASVSYGAFASWDAESHLVRVISRQSNPLEVISVNSTNGSFALSEVSSSAEQVVYQLVIVDSGVSGKVVSEFVIETNQGSVTFRASGNRAAGDVYSPASAAVFRSQGTVYRATFPIRARSSSDLDNLAFECTLGDIEVVSAGASHVDLRMIRAEGDSDPERGILKVSLDDSLQFQLDAIVVPQ